MINFAESTSLLAALAKPLDVESVELDDADGQVLARAVLASRNAPPFAVSAMDGYAVRDQDLAHCPVFLPIAGKSFAGSPPPGPLAPGTCMRIFTGAPLPADADRVIIQEDVVAEGDAAHFSRPLSASRHVRTAGSDFAAGDVLVAAGVPLNPQRLVAVAASDATRVDVIRRPRVSILANGDELRPVGSPAIAPHHIPDSLTPALKAMVRRWHGTVAGSSIAPDDLALLQEAAAKEVARSDVVVVTGGASVGEKDFAKTMFAALDLRLVFSKVAIRPGKPVWLGVAGKAVILGLPGNPTSALVTARLFLAPLLAGLAGLDPFMAWEWKSLPSLSALAAGGDRHTFLRAKASGTGVEALRDQDSGAQKALAATDYLISRAPGAPPSDAGASVEVLRF
jgi:molybdopterin molybdotransferase